MKWKSLSHVWLFVTPWTIQSMGFSRPEYWSGSLSLLQGIFPTQGSSPGLPHCRWILYQLSHKRRARILEWIAYPFSNGASRPRNGTGVSHIAGRFFTNWAMREALKWKWKSRSRVGLCNSMDCSLPCSSICGILQARVLEWVAISFSRFSYND